MWYIDHSHWVRDGCSATTFVKHVKTVSIQVLPWHTKQCGLTIVDLLWKSPAMLSSSTNSAYLSKTNLTCFTKIIAVQPSWSNMNELCTKLKKTKYVIMYWNQFCYISSSFFEKFWVKPGLSFTKLNRASTQNLEKMNFDMFYKNDWWAVICYPICMTNVSYERKIIVLSFPVISFVILIFVFQIFEIKSGFPFYWLTLYIQFHYFRFKLVIASRRVNVILALLITWQPFNCNLGHP